MIEKSAFLTCSPARAFELFTERASDWWPETGPSHARPAQRDQDARQRPLLGTRRDGHEVELGRVLVWEPPRRLVLDFYPGTDAEHPTEVVVQVRRGGRAARASSSSTGPKARERRALGCTRAALRALLELVLPALDGAARHASVTILLRFSADTTPRRAHGTAGRHARGPVDPQDAAAVVGVRGVPRRGARSARARRARRQDRAALPPALHRRPPRDAREAHGDWMPLGGGRRAEAGCRRHRRGLGALGGATRSGGWYGLKKGLRGRFGVYVPPVLEALGLAEVEHNPRNNRMRAARSPGSAWNALKAGNQTVRRCV